MIYLDSAATTLQKPPTVYRAVRSAMATMTSPGRGTYGPAARASRTLLACREAAAALFQVDQPERRGFLEHIMHKVGTDKTGAAGDQIGFHKFISSKFRCSKSLSVIAARCQLPRKGELFSAFPPDA